MSISAVVTENTAPALVAAHWNGPWDGPGPWWPVFPLLWLLFLATVITVAVVWARRVQRHGGRRTGEARLADRFAAGEIDEQEYRARRAVLRDPEP